MRNRLSITIPSRLIDFDCKHLIRTAVLIAGGATVLEARGAWYDADATEYKEHVLVHHMWYEEGKRADLIGAVNDIAAYLHGQGEKSVMIEGITYTSDGTQHNVVLLEPGRRVKARL